MKRLIAALFSLFLVNCTLQPPVQRREAQRATPSTIVLVHGLYGRPTDFTTLKTYLEREGLQTFAPAIKPNDGSLSLATQSEILWREVSRNLPAGTPIQLVGHSMGGLVCLKALQSADPHYPCRAVHTLASPHQGTILANLHPGLAAREMTPGSAILYELNERVLSQPLFTYRSSNDVVIIPNQSSEVPWARENLLIPSISHNALLRTAALHEALLQRIREQELRW